MYMYVYITVYIDCLWLKIYQLTKMDHVWVATAICCLEIQKWVNSCC